MISNTCVIYSLCLYSLCPRVGVQAQAQAHEDGHTDTYLIRLCLSIVDCLLFIAQCSITSCLRLRCTNPLNLENVGVRGVWRVVSAAWCVVWYGAWCMVCGVW